MFIVLKKVLLFFKRTTNFIILTYYYFIRLETFFNDFNDFEICCQRYDSI